MECQLALEFLQDPRLETLLLLHLFCHTQQLCHDFFDWLCPKSCEVTHSIWTQFSPAGIYCLGLDGVRGFLCNKDGILNGVILPDSHDVLSVGVLFRSVHNPFRRVSCVMSLKGP